MSSADDPAETAARIHALWLLLWPAIESRAKELGATPLDTTLALTIGTPSFVWAAAEPGVRDAALAGASRLFGETCIHLLRHGDR